MHLYSVNIVAPNYQPRSGTIDMASENREMQYWLLAGNRFAIEIKDKEGKAEPESGKSMTDLWEEIKDTTEFKKIDSSFILSLIHI